MKASDIFSYAFGAIKLRKLRAGLTTLGVVIGIAAVVALLSITQGLQSTIAEQLQTGFATDTLIVSPGTTSGIGGMVPGGQIGSVDFQLLVNDTQAIDVIEAVRTSVALVQKPCYVGSDEREFMIYVVGVDFAKYADVYGTFIAKSGEIPSNPENGTVVVGKRVSDPWDNGTLFCDVNKTVEIIWTNGTARPPENVTCTEPWHVSAVLEEVGGFGIGPSDNRVYIPISQAQNFFRTDECYMIIVQLENDDEATIESVSEAIKAAFDGQVSVTSSTAVLDIISNVFSTIELFLAGIAAISLLVAGIGIMNIMIVSLMERTREIGILKALGMKSRTVLLVFLSEAVIVGLMGSVIGIASGWGLAHVVVRAFSGGGGFMGEGNQRAAAGGMTINPALTPTVFFGAFAFGILISVIFALYPAWRASKLKPVDALRYE
jgi:putative ABC transport system permease protein